MVSQNRPLPTMFSQNRAAIMCKVEATMLRVATMCWLELQLNMVSQHKSSLPELKIPSLFLVILTSPCATRIWSTIYISHFRI